MYTLEYLPAAKKDIADISYYISHILLNPATALRLATEIVSSAEKLTDFPYANPVYTPLQPLEHEFRKLLVRNYIVFYWIDEETKIITIARSLYNRRDFDAML